MPPTTRVVRMHTNVEKEDICSQIMSKHGGPLPCTSLGNKYGASVSDSSKAILCYDTALKLALENFCLKEKADDHFQGENVEFGVSIEVLHIVRVKVFAGKDRLSIYQY